MRSEIMELTITAYGHENIQCTHPTTIEVTKEPFLTKRGDCIIGVRCSHSLSDLREKLSLFKGSRITVIFQAASITDEVTGFVHPALTFTDVNAIILRKSSFLCPKTLLIQSNKAAIHVKRELVEKMKDPQQKMVIRMYDL